MPGPACSLEDLRWYAIREIGSIKETARANGRNVHGLMKEIETLKGRVGTKAEAHLVQDEFTKIRRDTREEMVNLMAEVDAIGTEARLMAMNDAVTALGAQIQDAL